MIELEYHSLVTQNELMDLGIELLLISKRER